MTVVDFGGGNGSSALQLLGRGQVGDEPGVEAAAQAEKSDRQSQQGREAGCHTRPQEFKDVVS